MPSDDFTTLETKLRRSLMPVALSESATGSIHAMIDELSCLETIIPDAANSPDQPRISPWYAAAAAVAALLAVSAWFAAPAIENAAFADNPSDEFTVEKPAQTMHLVDESTRLAWVEDEGWLDDPDGGTLRAVRMRVVEENRLLDEETGIIVHVSSPREEMLLMPVSTF
jgi:hypothetical protein